MHHDASNVPDDFSQHSGRGRSHVAPCSVFASEKDLNEKTAGEYGCEESIAGY